MPAIMLSNLIKTEWERKNKMGKVYVWTTELKTMKKKKSRITAAAVPAAAYDKINVQRDKTWYL